MCLISWFPAGRCLKETLMRSLLLPPDYLKEQTEGRGIIAGLDHIKATSGDGTGASISHNWGIHGL